MGSDTHHCLLKKYAGPVDNRSLPAPFAHYIAVRRAVAGPRGIQHVQYRAWPTFYASPVWTARGLTGRTERMNTLCYLSVTGLYSMAEPFSPYLPFCVSCGSAIRQTPAHASWASSWDTTSPRGYVSFPSNRLIFCSMLKALLNALPNVEAPSIGFLIQLFGEDSSWTLWRDDDSSFVRTNTRVLGTTLRAETALAISAFQISNHPRTVLGI